MTPKGESRCCVCGDEAIEDHHVVPRVVVDNDFTVPLCGRCHAAVPGHPGALIAGRSLSQAGLERRRASGRQPNGTAAYGWEWHNGDVIPVAEQQAQIRQITGMYGADLKAAQIVRAMNAQGLLRYGKPWTLQAVRRVLVRHVSGYEGSDRAAEWRRTKKERAA